MWLGRKVSAIYLFVVYSFVLITDQALGYNITLNGNAVSSQPLEIHLNIGTINTLVALYRPDGSTAGACLAPLGGVSGGCGAGLTQDLTTGITTYSIASVSRATDQGVWTSNHGSDTGNIIITVLKKAKSVFDKALGEDNRTELTIPVFVPGRPSVSSLTLSPDDSNTQSVNIGMTCAYPAVSFGFSFVPTGGGAAVYAPSSTSVCTPTGNTGCTDTDANSYTCDITPQYETTLTSDSTYNIHLTATLHGQYQPLGLTYTITDTEITVQDGLRADGLTGKDLSSLSSDDGDLNKPASSTCRFL